LNNLANSLKLFSEYDSNIRTINPYVNNCTTPANPNRIAAADFGLKKSRKTLNFKTKNIVLPVIRINSRPD